MAHFTVTAQCVTHATPHHTCVNGLRMSSRKLPDRLVTSEVNSRLNTQDCFQHRHPDQNDFRGLQIFLGGHLSRPHLFQLTGPAGCWEGQAAPVLLALFSPELRRRLGSPSGCPPAERKTASPEVSHQQSARCQTTALSTWSSALPWDGDLRTARRPLDPHRLKVRRAFMTAACPEPARSLFHRPAAGHGAGPMPLLRPLDLEQIARDLVWL